MPATTRCPPLEGDPGCRFRLMNIRQWPANYLVIGQAPPQEAGRPSCLTEQPFTRGIYRVARFLSKYCTERLTCR